MINKKETSVFMKLINKNILITGGARGIGRALSEKLANNNNLILLSQNEKNLADFSGELLKKGNKIFYKKCNVANLSEVQDSFDFALKNMGSVDVLLLNAGISLRLDSAEYDFEKNKEIIDVNLFGVLNFLKYFVPYFVKRKSGIIAAVSSMADVRGFPMSAAYSASKAALTKYLEGIRLELEPFNIKVINIRPGYVDTDMIKKNNFKMIFIQTPEKAAEKIISGIEKEKSVINFPVIMRWITSLTKIMPDFIFNFIMRKAGGMRKEKN